MLYLTIVGSHLGITSGAKYSLSTICEIIYSSSSIPTNIRKYLASIQFVRVSDTNDLRLGNHSSGGWSNCPKGNNLDGLEISMPVATVSSNRHYPVGKEINYEFNSKT